jgi:hypothetical protein
VAVAAIKHANLGFVPKHQALRTPHLPPLPQSVPMLVVEQVTVLAVTTVGQTSHLYSVVDVVGGVLAEQLTA